MEAMIYRFTLDCRKSGTQEVLQGFSTGDNISRKLAITLVYGTSTYEIDMDHCEAMMYVKNPISGVTSINECTIESNTVYYTVTRDDIRNAGEVIMQLKIIYTDATTGVRKVLTAPRFALEVGESENLDDIIEEEISKRNFEGTFTALEKAVGRAQAVYHSRLVQIEFDAEHIFHAYYADGTEYYNDAIAQAYAEIVEARDITQEISEKAQSYAVGGTGTREGEDTDNARYYSERAMSAELSALEAKKIAEDAAQIALKYTSYNTFKVNYDKGTVEFDSINFTWHINPATGDLEYYPIEEGKQFDTDSEDAGEMGE